MSYRPSDSTKDPAFLQPPRISSTLRTKDLSPSTSQEKRREGKYPYLSQVTRTHSTRHLGPTHSTITDDGSEILIWLSPLEPRTRRQDVQSHRAAHERGGCFKPVNSRGDAEVFNMRDLTMQFYFAVVIWVSARFISGER